MSILPVNILFFILVASISLLSGCSTNQMTTEKSAGCSCIDYLPVQSRPSWLGGESSTAKDYLSNGLTECTGIQSMDFEEADISARTNLSHLISSHVENEVVLIQEDFGGGAGSNSGKVISKQSTNSLLEKSVIYDRWVDGDSCVVYSAVKVSQANIQETIKRIEAERNNKLLNQRFLVQAKGKYNSKLAERMQQLLVDSGVKKVAKTTGTKTYILNGVVASHEYLNQYKVAKVTVQLEIISPQKDLIWSQQVVGKGVSFGDTSKNTLLNKAIEHAVDNSKISIAEILQKQRN